MEWSKVVPLFYVEDCRIFAFYDGMTKHSSHHIILKIVRLYVKETLTAEKFWPHCEKGRKDESVPKLRSPKDDASSKLEKSDVQTIRA